MNALSLQVSACIVCASVFALGSEAKADGFEPGEYGAGISMAATGDPLFDGSLRLALADVPEGGHEAAGSGGGGAELAAKLQNPVADLISVPFQFNFDTGFGPKDGDKLTLNIQPVIPVSINEDWNVIIRTIMPVVHLASIADGISSETGLGDITQSFFFSPTAPVNGWIVGFGPVFLWPTATDEGLGGEKWGAGPTIVIVKQHSGWTYGMLANHIWSYAGDGDRDDINATFLQPFISYTFPTLTTLTFNTESTYDWTNQEWTVPLNLQVSQLLKFGGMPVQIALGGRYYAQSPDGGPEWGVRFVITFLFPK